MDAVFTVSMIDACHIVPFAKSYDDTISNGIALCPNLHRAFDRGLISIDNNYKVIVSEGFTEGEGTLYSIKQLAGSPILLPHETKFHPSKKIAYPGIESTSFRRSLFKQAFFGLLRNRPTSHQVLPLLLYLRLPKSNFAKNRYLAEQQ